MDIENTIELIRRSYMSLKPPSKRIGRQYMLYFKQYSYSRWAYKEAIRRIRADPNTPPIITLENLLRSMEIYSCDHNDSIMFSIAYDVIEDIVDILRCSD